MTAPKKFSSRAALFGNGPKTAKFKKFGDKVKGKIVSHDTVHAKNFTTKEPDYWPSGDPILEVQISLQVQAPTEEDDGTVLLKIDSRGKRDAMKEALGKVDLDHIIDGDELEMEYVADGPKKGEFNPPKFYRATYTRAQAASPADALAAMEEKAPF